jgi:ATPase subunit of ABC transporter with duplicated ATPase domains
MPLSYALPQTMMKLSAARLCDEPVSNRIPTLQVDNVTVTLGGTPVAKDVSFDLYETDLERLSGPNRAGKSTLLRVIIYLLPFA